MPDKLSAEGEVFFSREVVGGVPWVLVSKAGALVIQFGISIVLVRSLGTNDYGLLGMCRVIGEYVLVLCGLGLNTAIIRFTPELRHSQNRAGLIRLLVRTACLQAGMAILAGLALWLGKPIFDTQYFKIDSGLLLLLTALLVGVRLARFLVEDALTSLFHVATVSILTICHSVIWFALTASVLWYFPDVSAALFTQAGAALLFPIVGGALLILHVRRLDWSRSSYGIGKRRVLGLSLSSLLSTMGLVFLRQTSELLFLGIFFGSELVGLYMVGYDVPLAVIAFIPFAVQKLLTVGFAEAYTKDENSLGRLIASVYRVLIVILIPLSAFGFFFAPQGVELIYGAEMRDAGPIASLFCILHTLSCISIPLSMAIVAKEKILVMQPIMWLTISINLILDVLLIPRYGLYGGVAAVFLTYAITTPITLFMVRRVIGGIYFPTGLFIRVAVPVFVLAWGLSPLAPRLGLFGLFLVSAAYLAAIPMLYRLLKIIREDDVAELRGMGFGKLNRCLDFFVGKKKVG